MVKRISRSVTLSPLEVFVKSRGLSQRFVSRLTRETVALVLAGGRGRRLNGLTENRSKPAMPFGGKYRIIDFPLSNCLNSGIRRVGVLTQYKSHSLIKHLLQGWHFLSGEFNEFIDILPAQQQKGSHWYQGTADAVYQNLDILSNHAHEYVLVLGGDHVYKMDYGELLGYHVNQRADVTLATVPIPVGESHRFGVVRLDSESRIVEFIEKPAELPPEWGGDTHCLASMGVYVFNRDCLVQYLTEDAGRPESSHDFGHDVFPRLLAETRVMGFRFVTADGQPAYWRDIGDLDAYWRSNMELIEVIPECNLYDPDWPIWTATEQGPPAKFVFDEAERRGMALNSMIAGGCIISGSVIRDSVLCRNVWVEDGCNIGQSVILPGARIGRDCRIVRTVLEEQVVLPAGSVVGYDPEEDATRYERSPGGITLVR